MTRLETDSPMVDGGGKIGEIDRNVGNRVDDR